MKKSDFTLNPAILQEISEAFTSIPFNQLLGLKLAKVNLNEIILSFDMKDELIGNFLQGILHGGVISSVLDMAGGMVTMVMEIYKNKHLSVSEMVEIIGKTSTVDMHISYLSPGRGQQFNVKASILKSGKKLSFTKMELFNQDDKLLATAIGTYLVK